MKPKPSLTVPAYIASCPKTVQGSLRKIRAAIRATAPGATERTDYFNWPGYSYSGDYDYSGMFAWFSYKKPHIRLMVRPPVVANHKKELHGCKISVGGVGFPEDKPIPLPLVKRMVKKSIKVMKRQKS